MMAAMNASLTGDDHGSRVSKAMGNATNKNFDVGVQFSFDQRNM